MEEAKSIAPHFNPLNENSSPQSQIKMSKRIQDSANHKENINCLKSVTLCDFVPLRQNHTFRIEINEKVIGRN